MAKFDLQDLLRRLDAIPQSVRRKVEPAVEKGAEEMVKRMRYLAPDDPSTPTGDLKSKIVVVNTGVPMARRVQAIDKNAKGEDVAMFQEYGTLRGDKGRQQTAQPFFWVSVNSSKKRVRRRIDRAISKAIREEWTK